MSEENNLLEEELEFDILTLLDDEGNEHQFELADSVDHNDFEYLALIPIYETADDLLADSGELVIMKVMEEDGEDYLDPIEDDEEYMEISEIFMSRLEDEFDFEDDIK